MRRACTLLGALALLALLGCSDSHGRDRDAGAVISDAATADDAGPDTGAPTTSTPPGAGVVCGPNRCRGAEICCDASCGICGLEGECPPDFVCPGP